MLTTKNDEFLNTEIESDWYSKFPKDFTKFDLSLIFNIIVIYLSIKFIDNLFRNLFSLKKKSGIYQILYVNHWNIFFKSE